VTPDAASLTQLLRQVQPGLQVARARKLAGGVSAQVTVIAATAPDGQLRHLVVRQYGQADLLSNPHVACTECRLLSLLHAAGQPVPWPYLADESCAILPTPYLVLEYIDGEPPAAPADLPEFTGQLAAALADLHGAGFARSDAAYLPGLARSLPNCWERGRLSSMNRSARRPSGRPWRATGHRRRSTSRSSCTVTTGPAIRCGAMAGWASSTGKTRHVAIRWPTSATPGWRS